MALLPRPNPAGSQFPMGGGTLAQLAVQPQRRVMGAPAPTTTMGGATGFQGPISSTTSPGFPGASIPTGTPFPGVTPPAAAPAATAPAMQDRSEWLRNTPGYNFVFDEAMRATKLGAAGRGTLFTGGTLRELADRGAGLASQQFEREADRLGRLTQLGQSGAQQLANYGTGYSATNAGLAQVGANNAIGLGNAQAGGTLAGVNAEQGMGNAIANNLGQIDWAKLFGKKPATTAPQSGLSARNFAGATFPVTG